MDGTLLNSKGQVSDVNRHTLKEFTDVPERYIAICSARPLNTLIKLLIAEKVFPYIRYIAGFNGAQIYDTKEQSLIFERKMTSSEIRHIDQSVKLNHYNHHYFTADEIRYINHKNASKYTKYESKVFGLPAKAYRPSEILNSNDIYKITICGDQPLIPVYQSTISENLPSDFKNLVTGNNYIDIQPNDINKGYAIEIIKYELSISSKEVIAIGDQQNDVPMFRAAGTAIAMGNANDEVRAESDMVTADNDRNGVACAIKRLIC